MKVSHLLLLLALIFVVGCSHVLESEDSDDSMMEDSMEIDGAMMEDGESMASSKKTFTLTGKNFRFMMDGQETPDLKVKQGDTVRIEFSSVGGFHDWVVDEFNAATERVSEGGSTFVEFVADTKGTFEYYCSVGSHRAQGMVGNLIVE